MNTQLIFPFTCNSASEFILFVEDRMTVPKSLESRGAGLPIVVYLIEVADTHVGALGTLVVSYVFCRFC